ncbi:hypothetical protein ABD91_20550 [Lysinibacillus sphaericus]|uniref:hypothetical protein n=1 Tax=Lysinibacillus sphaericus TaxID=1421 RepID=UPI0018CC89A5|nr:hypothetical protein [Lysinibacillus sphaericus]MBG9693134.1 hypothetical protein [Lysinibacillus sphaericus]
MLVNDKLEESKQFALKNGASEIIKELLRKSNCSIKELAQILCIKPQSFSTKLLRNRFTFYEVQLIAHLLDSQVVVLKDGQKIEVVKK